MFNSTILTLPGIGGSGPEHWQSLWEQQYGFTRIEQQDWDSPLLTDWVDVINDHVAKYNLHDTILVAHSAACVALVHWAAKYNLAIKGALLVAPADAESDTFPKSASGFSPMPLIRLPFPSIVVTSTNDEYVTLQRAQQFAEAWGSEFINIGDAGHINIASGYGEWNQGLDILRQLD